jgi:hypothetical protein
MTKVEMDEAANHTATLLTPPAIIVQIVNDDNIERNDDDGGSTKSDQYFQQQNQNHVLEYQGNIPTTTITAKKTSLWLAGIKQKTIYGSFHKACPVEHIIITSTEVDN